MTTGEGELLAGRYRLDERVGVGAMGEVWRAHDLTLRRDVAVKRVRLDGQVDAAAQNRFRREAVAMAGVAHPNVVSVYDSGTDVVDGRETAYLVMELLDGPSCSELIRSARVLDFGEIERIGAGVARGLAAAHAAGVVHRDIKPGNVVVSRGVPTIVDFGIARLEQESTSTLTAPQTTIGTAAYMSPEQSMGKHVGPASDVYSLGALLVALASGSPPFGATNALALMRAHIDDSPPLLSDLRPGAPAPLTELVDRMLAKDPAARPTAAEVAVLLGGDEPDPALAAVPPTAVLPPAAAPAAAPAPGAGAVAPVAGAEKPASQRTTAEIAPVGPATAQRVPGESAGGAAGARGGPSTGGRILGWLAAALLLGALVLLAWNLFLSDGGGDPAAPPTTPRTGTSPDPAPSPTEHLVTPTGAPTGGPTTDPVTEPATPESEEEPPVTDDPAPQTLDDAVAEADGVIRGIEAEKGREEVVRVWQGASNGLQGANAAEHLEEVIDKADDWADEGELTDTELAAVRAAVERVISLLP